jgi:hypothetical protein
MRMFSVTKLNWRTLLQNTDTVTFTRMSDSHRGFGLDIGFIDQFTTLFVITLN